jgi:hypothetical protein
MKCPVIKRYLLRLENPDRPCQAVRDHLSRCPACRSTQEGLLQLENEVRLLPLPESDAKVPFLRNFRGGKIGASPAADRHWLPWQVRDRARRKLALAASLAAGIVLFAIGWGILHRTREPGPKPTPQPSVQSLQLQRDLSTARSNSERIKVYSSHLKSLDLLKVAKESSDEELSETVSFYQGDFLPGLLAEAKEVPEENRKEMLASLAVQLESKAGEADYAARYQNDSKAEKLRTFAVAARKGAADVRSLMAQAT